MAAIPGGKSHHLLRLPAFSSKRLKVGGDRQALNAISEGAGPSWRMVVEMGSPIKAFGVYPGGQSGNPGSPYYDSMLTIGLRASLIRYYFCKSKLLIMHPFYSRKPLLNPSL